MGDGRGRGRGVLIFGQLVGQRVCYLRHESAVSLMNFEDEGDVSVSNFYSPPPITLGVSLLLLQI